ncbi:MAG: DUF2064 domain-containing protein [Salinibacter sp.]
MPESRTAILFFSHRPGREWQNKWFVRQDYATNRQVAAAFYEHTREAVAESSFPVLEVAGAQQRGDSFGARLANAFADAFAAGYDRVIAVGNDCPTLHEVDWTSVDEQLENGTPVLGPTADRAGTYLIGVTRSQFDWEAFAALPWQSPNLLLALRGHFAAEHGTTPTLLAPRADVNNHGELVHLLRRSAAPGRLVARLRSVLGEGPHPVRAERREVTRSSLERRSRAPPSVSTEQSRTGTAIHA